MRSFLAFFRKELLASTRRGLLFIILGLFVVFGVMNVTVTYFTPMLLELLEESLAESGMTLTGVAADSITCYAQFFKNVSLFHISFVLIYGSIFTNEYRSGTLILLLTKGLSRTKVLLAKALVLFTVWTLGYFLGFLVTYAGNAAVGWGNDLPGIPEAIVGYWLFGVLTVALMVFFSAVFTSYVPVLLGVGGVVTVFTLVSIAPKIANVLPTALITGAPIFGGEYEAVPFIVTAVLSVALVIAAIPVMKRRSF